MRILMLVAELLPGGILSHLFDLTEGLNKLGHEIYLMTGEIDTEIYKDNAIEKRFKANGVVIKELKVPKGNLLKRRLNQVKFQLEMMLWVRKINPHIIHSHSPYLAIIPWIMNRQFIVSLHGTYNMVPNFRWKRPDYLIVGSKMVFDYGKEMFDITNDRIIIVPYGVSERFSVPEDGKTLQNLRKKHGIDEEKVVLILAGRISPEKGQDIMVEALKKLDKRIKNKIHFIFLGGKRNEKSFKWLESLIEESQIHHFTSIIPWEDPKPFYDITDILVLPSREEGSGLVVAEAMLGSCCIIRSNTGGAPEQIVEGHTGYVFENEDTSKLAELIEILVEDTSLRTAMMSNCKRKALNEFTTPKMIQRTFEVYEKLAGSNQV